MQDKKIIFIALSKKNFYARAHIIKFVLEKNAVPISQYAMFEYFLLDTVDRNTIRNANNNLIKRADELWVFGEISDGVAAEIKLCKKLRKPIKYFDISKLPKIEEVSEDETKIERD